MEKGDKVMIKVSKLLVVTVLFVAVAAISAASAGASLPQPDRAKAVAHVIQIRHTNVGLPPFVGGPYGDPSDFPGASGSVIHSDTSTGASDAVSSDDCLHQIVLARTAC
jgi:hypothetical protein